MRKVAILTLNGYFNYGNRLQNYALQEVLKSMGFDVETIIVETSKIRNQTNPNQKSSYLRRIKNFSKKSPNEILDRLQHKIMHLKKKNDIGSIKEARDKLFKTFSTNYIKETDYFISDTNIPDNLTERYDFFITGSDQVWNPNYNYGSSIYFITFADRSRRIAYAPSFGVSEIKPEFVEDYKKWISGMHRLSVRENDGAKIIKELTGRDVPVLVDPTLLLTREKWLSISKEPSNKPKEKYLLTYFLGGASTQNKKQIKDIAKKNKLEVVRLGDIREKETYRTGPSEYIDYINSCSIMCTDSFHGVVFSILFKKPFIVYERVGTSLSMYSRIETLLDMFDFKSREVKNIKASSDIFNIDYSHVPSILEKERNRSFSYLKEALNIKDEK